LKFGVLLIGTKIIQLKENEKNKAQESKDTRSGFRRE
jgi:hypothetical protein